MGLPSLAMMAVIVGLACSRSRITRNAQPDLPAAAVAVTQPLLHLRHAARRCTTC